MFSKVNTDVPKIWARPLTTGQRPALNVNFLSGRAALRRADDNLRSVNCTRYFLVATADRQFRGIHGDQIGDEWLFVSNNLADGVRQGTGPALRTDRDPVAAVVHRQTAGVLGTHRHAGGDVTVRDHAQARFLVLAVRAVGLAVAGLVFGDALLRFDAIILRRGALSYAKKVTLPRPLQKYIYRSISVHWDWFIAIFLKFSRKSIKRWPLGLWSNHVILRWKNRYF